MIRKLFLLLAMCFPQDKSESRYLRVKRASDGSPNFKLCDETGNYFINSICFC